LERQSLSQSLCKQKQGFMGTELCSLSQIHPLFSIPTATSLFQATINFLLGNYTSLLPGHLASALAYPPCKQPEWPFKVINPVMCFIGIPFHLGKSPDSLSCSQGKMQLLGPSLTSFLVSHPPAPILHSWQFLEHGQTLSTSAYLYLLFSILFSTEWRKAGSLTTFSLYLSMIFLLALSLVCSPSLLSIKTFWSVTP